MRLDMCPTGWEQFEGDDWWPVFLNVRYADNTQSKFTLALCWNARSARPLGEAEDLRRRLTSVDPRFGKHSDSRWRRVMVKSGLGLPDLLRRMAEFDGRLSKALSE